MRLEFDINSYSILSSIETVHSRNDSAAFLRNARYNGTLMVNGSRYAVRNNARTPIRSFCFVNALAFEILLSLVGWRLGRSRQVLDECVNEAKEQR